MNCKLDNVIIDNGESDEYEEINLHVENNVEGVPEVYFQDELYMMDKNVIRDRTIRMNKKRREEIRGEVNSGGTFDHNIYSAY